MSEFGPPFFRQPGFNPISLTTSVAQGAFARALTIADVTDGAGERAVLATTQLDDERARQLAPGASPKDLGFDVQPPARAWRLRLAPDLQASDGQTLGYPWVAFVEQMHYRPFIALGALDEAVWEATGGPLLPLTTRNMISISQWLAPVARTEVMPRLLELKVKNPDAAPPEAELRRLTTLTPDVLQTDGLDVTRLLSAKGTGLVWAVVTPDELLDRSSPGSGKQS